MAPRAATEHYAAQQRLSNVVVAAVRRAWRGLAGNNWGQAWRTDVGPKTVEVVTAGQEAAARQSELYMAAVLAELGIESEVPTALNIPSFAGFAGDGRPVESLLFGGVIHAAKAQYTPQMQALPAVQMARDALAEGERWMAEVAASIMEDAARAAQSAAMGERTWLKGWVRMLNGKSCSRCVVLAGKFYLHNSGFLRHPGDDCFTIPADEAIAGDLTVDPQAYFDSLTPAEQDEAFTQAGAEAIRLGADIGQVVNARRGMTTVGETLTQRKLIGDVLRTVNVKHRTLAKSSVYGRDIFTTTEGATTRGIFGNNGRPVRLMPESILAIATDRQNVLDLLKLYGYVT